MTYLNLDTKSKRVRSFARSRKETPVHIEQENEWPLCQTDRCGEETNILLLK
jgi:hypothetical protein